jgi:hypothetical protein
VFEADFPVLRNKPRPCLRFAKAMLLRPGGLRTPTWNSPKARSCAATGQPSVLACRSMCRTMWQMLATSKDCRGALRERMNH